MSPLLTKLLDLVKHVLAGEPESTDAAHDAIDAPYDGPAGDVTIPDGKDGAG
jgi:hypothetical protein